MTAGNLYAVAGDGVPGYSGDGGPAISAEVSARGVAVNGPNLVIGDKASTARVRVVSG